MSISIEQITDALRNVNHPSGGTDIVSMKMVNDINVEGNKISFTLVFSKLNDPLATSIKKGM